MTKDMKHNIDKLIILLAVMFAATGSKAQNVDKLHAQDGLFNHLSVGLNTGLTGSGVDVVMPVHKLVTVRAGFSGWNIGDIKFNAINTGAEINQMQMVEDDAVKRSQMVDKVELAIKPNFWNFYVLGEIHPFRNQPFYFSAGLFIGSQNFVRFQNTNENALDFLYDANQKVKPYLGIGLGQHLAKTHRVSLAVDLGLLFWGTPKFLLDSGTEIESTGKSSGLLGTLSWLKAWPNLQIRVAYKIF